MSVNIKVTRPLGSSVRPDTVNLRLLLGSRVSCCRITALPCIVETDGNDPPVTTDPGRRTLVESHPRSLCTTRDVTKRIEPGHATVGHFRLTVRAYPQESPRTTSLHVARSLRCVTRPHPEDRSPGTICLPGGGGPPPLDVRNCAELRHTHDRPAAGAAGARPTRGEAVAGVSSRRRRRNSR